MNEVPFFLGRSGHELFAVFHEPAGRRTGRAFICCHPFAEEKLWSHRVFVSYARQLASQGHAVLRFDFAGNGDSDGQFSTSTVETAIADVQSAIVELRRRAGVHRMTLLGLRFGATIASLVAERHDDVDDLVLWAPIVDGQRYMQDLLRTNIATQTAVYREVRRDRQELVESMRQGLTVNVDGYELGLAMYSELSSVQLASTAKTHRGRCLVVQIDRQPGRGAAELEALVASYRKATLAVAKEEPFWREITRFYDRAPALFAVTSDWLDTFDSDADEKADLS